MPVYITSDVHLRLDRPERAGRFARFVDRLDATDSLMLVGDLCDFWFAARQSGAPPAACAGIKSLVDFRARGGAITLLPGNHDASMGPYFEKVLGVPLVDEPLHVDAYGLRLILVHGHNTGARTGWKRLMESRAFLATFQRLPAPVASRLDHLLERRNSRKRDTEDWRHLDAHRRYAASCAGAADLVFMGHVHRVIDEAGPGPRLVVPGGWHHQASYLKVDETGATLILEPDPAPIPC